MIRPGLSRKMIPAIALFLFLLFHPSAFPVYGEGNREVLAQYKAALAKIDSRGAKIHLEGKYVLSVSANGKLLVERKEELLIARDGEKVLIRHRERIRRRGREVSSKRAITEPGEDIALFSPPDYYTIQSHGSGGPYFLTNRTQINDENSRASASYNYDLLGAPFSLFTQPIVRLLDDPNFVVTGVDPEHGGTSKRWKISFKIKNDSVATKSGSGWFVVDPDLNWALVSFEYHTAKEAKKRSEEVSVVNSTTIGTITYGPLVDGNPMPERIMMTSSMTLSNGQKHQTEQSLEVTSFEWSPYPEEAFTLDYYGLGDLAASTRARAVWRGILLLLGSGALIGLSIYLTKYRNRNKSASPGSNPPSA